MRDHLERIETLHDARQKQTRLLAAVEIYCDAVIEHNRVLAAADVGNLAFSDAAFSQADSAA